jgi:hypothetical protein
VCQQAKHLKNQHGVDLRMYRRNLTHVPFFGTQENALPDFWQAE